MRRAVVLLLAVAALAGCGLGSGSSSGEVTLTVTRDFGADTLRPPKTEGAHRGDTVMRLLQRDFDVKTRYGGGFVQEIDGLSGGREDGRRVDWFYYVNGLEASQGAAQRHVSPDDRIWWDHHDWTAAMRIPAVVGSYPEPFASGTGGKRLPIRLVCVGSEVGRSCDEVEKRLEDADVTKVARASLAQSVGLDTLRILVGGWADVRKDVAARTLEDGPGASGVFARPAADGRRIALLDARKRPVRELGPGGGLVAATQTSDQGPTWFVTGTDTVGVAAAAGALNEDELRDHFALAIDQGRTIPLPVEQPETPQEGGDQ